MAKRELVRLPGTFAEAVADLLKIAPRTKTKKRKATKRKAKTKRGT